MTPWPFAAGFSSGTKSSLNFASGLGEDFPIAEFPIDGIDLRLEIFRINSDSRLHSFVKS